MVAPHADWFGPGLAVVVPTVAGAVLGFGGVAAVELFDEHAPSITSTSATGTKGCLTVTTSLLLVRQGRRRSDGQGFGWARRKPTTDSGKVGKNGGMCTPSG